jgi:hypothetical protein
MAWSLVFISYFIPLVFVFALLIVDLLKQEAALRPTRQTRGADREAVIAKLLKKEFGEQRR